MGKAAAKQSEQLASQAADRYSTLATQLAAESAPQRKEASDYYSAIVKGGPQAYTAIAPQVDFAKQQFANARRTQAQTAPAGGAQTAGNRQLASNEASTVSGLYRDKIGEALQQLTQLGEFGTQGELSATGGITSTSQALAQLSAMRAQAVASGVGGIAGSIGTYFGMKK